MPDKPDFQRIGQSHAASLADAHPDFEVFYYPEKDVYRVRHIGLGRTVDVTTYELERYHSASQAVVKNAILRIAAEKLMADRTDV